MSETSLPLGWENRRNNFSEKDMKLGASAMGTFSSKGLLAGAYADGSENHKTSEEVEAHWMGMIEKERKEEDEEAAAAGEGAGDAARGGSSLPWGFQNRIKVREAEAKAYGAHEQLATEAVLARAGLPSKSLSAAFGGGRHAPPPVFIHAPPPGSMDENVAAATAAAASSSAFVPSFAPSSYATPESALLNVAVNSLETLAAVLNARPVPLDAEDRAKFAAAVKRAMDAVLHAGRDAHEGGTLGANGRRQNCAGTARAGGGGGAVT
eukprot:CAMPEP_0197576522 /NCGR_PEP_ID=MMETSP1326-20131121/1526_1 /TAXON_ID=1155430 /ORGANISM="Genus nov. species nov., Strain RCC2288" /LENGTH=265 /DNA_ID=CAMNT_0043139471 /DNA_START=107 /DNA_END=901 /DNA_ORIENTATION=+